VLGCADLVAAHPGAAVITVTAGRPAPIPATEWGQRQAEDEAALRMLGARPVWLGFLERQYGEPPSRRGVVDALDEVIRNTGATLVVSPLGLSNDDHVLTAAASFEVARRRPGMRWLVYEDAIYRMTDGTTLEALARHRDAGFLLEEAVRDFPPAGNKKRAAIDCYPTQLKALGDRWLDALQPERYWSVVARP
jgi:LmbE family N-acetylglucosaminyl deacetylase